MRITIAQLNPKIADFKKNWEDINKSLQEAHHHHSQFVIFPELTCIGYPAKDLLFKKHILQKNNELLEKIQRASERYPNLAIVVGALKETHNRRYNAAFVIQKGKILFYCHKSLLPNDDVFDEKRYFDSQENNTLFTLNGQKIALTICEEAWCKQMNESPLFKKDFPKPDLIINLSASPYYLNKEIWRHKRAQDIIRHHGCPFIFVNQVGGQDDLIFDGNSFVMNSQGKLTHRLPAFESKIEHLNLNNETVIKQNKQTNEEKLVNALCLGIKDYFHKTGFSKATLGLSGGIDSALCYVLTCMVLGADNVQAIMLPSTYTSQESIRDAKAMTDIQKQKLIELSIQESYQSLCKTLSGILDNSKITLAHENIQARLRGLMLMAYSNHHQALLINTSNKSEIASGYSTLYGDLCGALSPIGDLTKKQVYDLAIFLNKNNKQVIPDYVIERAPSAELKPNQKDQDSLPEYEIIDQTLHCILEDKPHHNPTLEKKLFLNEFKRQQAPTILKVSPIAFGSGWRFPITANYGNN